MGIIKRQAIGYSIVNYAGVAIGSLSTLFLYPRDLQAYGLFRFLLDTANMMMPFAMLGATYVSIRMFPEFKDEKRGNRGLWSLLSLMALIGTCIMALLCWGFQPIVFSTEGMKDKVLFDKYIFYIIPLFAIYGYFVLLRQYSSNFLKIIVPSVLDQLIKISFPAIFILYLFRIIGTDGLVYGILIHFVVMLLLNLFYLKSLGELSYQMPDFASFSSEKWKEIGRFGLYGLLGSGSAMLALRIDTLMVSKMMGDLHNTGSFNNASLIGSNIAVPLTAITAIAAPIISKAWKEDNLLEIKKIYQKSSENLLLIGLFLFGGIILCVNDLFAIMPKRNSDFSAEIMVVYIVGFKSVIDMATGVNDLIIGYSKHYNFNLYAIAIMAIMNIVGNLVLIPHYGIIGAALSTFISNLIYNAAKFIFIKMKFGLMPYTFNAVKILLINVLLTILCYFLPDLGNPYLNILFKGGIFTLLVVGSAIYFDASPDMTGVKQQILKRIKP